MAEIPPPAATLTSRAFVDGREKAGVRLVPEETPIALSYDRNTYAVMLATPADLEDFAVGFSLNEAIAAKVGDIRNLEIVTADQSLELRMDLAPHLQDAHNRRRRSLAGPTGCGMCGLESLAEVTRPAPMVSATLEVSPEEICSAMATLAPAQILNQATRAVHAAGFWLPQTGLVALREDVGRHNALDKLAGALARGDCDGAAGVVILTSRVSLEMVQKTARIGCGIFVAVSAPTALAVRTAEQCGITLIAIARDRDFEVFTHPRRIHARAPGVV